MFFEDVKEWGLKVAFYNFRFMLAYRLAQLITGTRSLRLTNTEKVD